MLVLLVMAVALTGCTNLSRWQTFYSQGAAAQEKGDFGAAIELYEAGLKDAKMFHVPAREYLPMSRALAHLNTAPETSANYVATALEAGDRQAIFDAYESLAWTMEFKRNFRAAKEVDEQAAETCAATFGADSMQRAWFEMRAASAEVELKQPAQALERTRAIEPTFRRYSPHNEDNHLAFFLATKAKALEALGQGNAACECYLEALKLPAQRALKDNLRRESIKSLDHYGFVREAHREYEEYLKAPNLPLPKPTYKQVVQGFI
jgi:hypothetical protein